MSGRIELLQTWRLRNAAATALTLSEEQMRRAVSGASIEELVALIETFSPARSTSPGWTRSFEPLVERLWARCDDATIAALIAPEPLLRAESACQHGSGF